MRSYKELTTLEKIELIVKSIVLRNKIICHDYNRRATTQKVNVNYWKINSLSGEDNLGDYLSLIVVENMIKMNNIDSSKTLKKTKHLYAVGSILFTGFQDCTVWGTGIIREYNKTVSEKITLLFNKYFRKLDIRCVRGPKTRQFLLENGIKCPECYGDPAILMPIFYKAEQTNKKRDYLIVLHYTSEIVDAKHSISMKTSDYKRVIDDICSSKKVVTNSLHGLILAESYGVPAVVFNLEEDFNMLKYDDYYMSTNRNEYPVAKSIEEAIHIEPLELPNLKLLQDRLIRSFPADVWKD